ncbi:MAG TPA: MGMT family protein [Candidatus Blautia faecigallinarum]|uniref:MGMT family protein n=1 Tax=Candidatus Blautia faecigallinarum TaxID=2838488 RepID=A0A9D2ITB0_9FIRM|nr:MGMT family protein [Candidatus Blautia faecigallinarum]
MNDFVNFFEKVYEIVNTVPRGCVMSYGQVAALAGSPRMARQVGWALHVCPDQVPWHRIIRKDGSLPEHSSPGTENRQRTLLEEEGVIFDKNGRVKKEFFLFHGNPL